MAQRRGPGGVVFNLPPAPRGPFFDSETRFFADHIADAAQQWLQVPNVETSVNPTGRIELVVPDPRAFFSSANRDAEVVCIKIAGTDLENKYVALKRRTLQGAEERVTVPVTKAEACYQSTAQMFSVEGFLFDDEGFCYDRLTESEQRTGIFAEALLGRREQIEPAYRALVDALLRGEDDLVEFKEWLPLDGKDKKSSDLLKTVCAFANAGGGSLYVGVTKEAEVVGTRERLRTEKEDEYLTRLYRIAREGLAPSVIVRGTWLDHAEHRVLRLDIEASTAKPIEVTGTRQVYVRRGASSRRATVEEIRLMIDGTL
jgi:hypothetical protein